MPTPQMRAAHRMVGPAMRSWLRLEVHGQAHVPGAGGVLLLANHRSFMDHFAMFAACPRPMRFLGKQELARGLSGRFNVAMGMVPVARGGADVTAIRAVVDLLHAGEVVGAFPEGTRSPTGHLYRFRSGAARIAAASGQPVVPVGIVGTDLLRPVARMPACLRPPPGSVRITFGAPLSPPAADARSRRAFTAALHKAVAGLCGQPVAEGFAPIASLGPGG